MHNMQGPGVTKARPTRHEINIFKPTYQEVNISTHYEYIKGNTKRLKLGGLG